jgi:uncharacterized protein (DUF1778 family)
MAAITRTTDRKARVSLPRAFANATILIEEISDTELRIRKAQVIPEDDIRFREEVSMPLSDRDRDIFLALLEKPPAPNKALKKLVAKHKRRHG